GEGESALLQRGAAPDRYRHGYPRRVSLPAHRPGAGRDGRTIPPMSDPPAAEAEELLKALIRFNTVNPPGNELAAQEYLAGHLSGAGFECELLGATPERPNLVARLRAEGAASPRGRTLCYLGHVDTVLADPAEWRHDPWSGELADGFLWGRGAIDMKSQVAAEVAAG